MITLYILALTFAAYKAACAFMDMRADMKRVRRIKRLNAFPWRSNL